jgi:brefeldin A-resistance guanine nucleotide exchange factor 1
MIPLQGNATTPLQAQTRSDGGLLSTLSSYLMTPYGSESVVPDVTERDIESTLSAIDCIAACRLDELYLQIASVILTASLILAPQVTIFF